MQPQHHQQVPQQVTSAATPAPAAPVMQAVPMVQVFNPTARAFQYLPLPGVCQMFRAQGRFWDLEQLLSTSQVCTLH